ncbi:MAG: transcription termination factor Rho [Bacteroidaceae bacterium]|nr:transcription termination factor Rho [Bacteroidaceae bacterium]
MQDVLRIESVEDVCQDNNPAGGDATSDACAGDTQKRKRTRVVKKDAVYTVNGMEGENLDTKAVRKSMQKKIKESQKELFSRATCDTGIEEIESKEGGEEEGGELFLLRQAAKADYDTNASNEGASKAEEGTEGLEENANDQRLAEYEQLIKSDVDFIIIKDIPVEDFGELNTDAYEKGSDRERFLLRQAAKADYDIDESSTVEAEEEKEVSFDFKDKISIRGVLEMMPDGYGFLRSSEYNYVSSPDDVYVANQFVKQYGLKTGDVIECKVRPPYDGEKFFTLSSVSFVNGRTPDEVRDRIPFEHLTPLFPNEKYCLCGDAATTNKSTRIVDLFSPIGKGQRALIVAQPKTGKTILMKDIANAIAANHPEAYLMMLLIDERPEEVTDMARTVNAEVIASTFDEPADKHVKIAGLVLEKAKRMVECGHDVVIFLDSITRLARAYNTVAPASGKVLTGGVDANALQKPKRFFGAARNIENGGSLTIIATALIDTGSKMDEVIFEEFKGTGNMELQLERALSNKRIFPAVNLVASSTRRDDLLQDENTLGKMWIMRKHIADMNPLEAMNVVQHNMDLTKNNEEFLMSMNS